MAIKNYKKGSETLVAPNFRAREFDCNGSGCCGETPIDEKLVEYLQKIRDHFGKPVHITGYRCKAYNSAVPNAAPNSYHIYGMAADLSIEGVDPLEIAKYAESMGVLGIGHYDTFVHIDTRTTKSFWYSHDQVRRSTFGGAPEEKAYTREQFVRDVQAATGAGVDGIAGKETLGKTITVSARKNRTHPVVLPVQKWLYAQGYTMVGQADGVAGEKFDEAVRTFQKDNRCQVDGELTAAKQTWKKLLGMG